MEFLNWATENEAMFVFLLGVAFVFYNTTLRALITIFGRTPGGIIKPKTKS